MTINKITFILIFIALQCFSNEIDFLDAARNNDYATVKKFIDGDINVNISSKVGREVPSLYDYSNETALYYAVKNGNANMVRLLLEKGADINIVPNYISSLLGSLTTNLEIVNLLLHYGADKNKYNEDGYDALMVRLIMHDISKTPLYPIVEKLLENYDINKKTKDGTTILALALGQKKLFLDNQKYEAGISILDEEREQIGRELDAILDLIVSKYIIQYEHYKKIYNEFLNNDLWGLVGQYADLPATFKDYLKQYCIGCEETKDWIDKYLILSNSKNQKVLN